MTEKMAIFRAKGAPQLTGEDGKFEPLPPGAIDGWGMLFDAGLADGNVVKRLFDLPGFSLVYNWFKPNFPLPRHSHNQDCLYYIISGSIRLGTEDLGAGDGFFVGAHVPYTYIIGPEGVEVLEFRQQGAFTSRSFAATQKYWDKAIASIKQNRDAWNQLIPPRPAQ